MEAPSRSKRARRQVASTYATTFSLMLGRLLVYKWSPEFFDEKNFALYVIGLRELSLGYLALGPALVAGLTYQVARVGTAEQERDGPYLTSCYLLTTIVFGPLLLVSWLAPELCAKLALGSAEHVSLVLPLVAGLVGQYLTVIPLAYLMGKTDIGLANLIAVSSGFALPVACLWFFHESAEQVFWVMAWTSLAFGLVTNLLVILFRVDQRWGGLKAHAWRLYGYSLPRVPAAAGVAFLLAQPVVVPTHRTPDLTVAAIFAAGGTLVGMASSLIQPLALVLLPHAAQMLAEDQHQEVRRRAWTMLKGLGAASVAVTVLAALSTKWILGLWLGTDAVQYAFFWLGILPAMIPIAIYRAFSSLLNAAGRRAYDTENVGISMLLFAGVFWFTSFGSWEVRLLFSFNLSMYLLAGLTVVRVFWLLKERAAKPSG